MNELMVYHDDSLETFDAEGGHILFYHLGYWPKLEKWLKAYGSEHSDPHESGTVGYRGAAIRLALYDCDIPDGATVLTWGEVSSADGVDTEGFYCTTEYHRDWPSAGSTAKVEGVTGPGVDFASWKTVPSSDWCSAGPCARQPNSEWQPFNTDFASNFATSYDAAQSTSVSKCTAHRLLGKESSRVKMPYPFPTNDDGEVLEHPLKAGYMIFNTAADY